MGAERGLPHSQPTLCVSCESMCTYSTINPVQAMQKVAIERDDRCRTMIPLFVSPQRAHTHPQARNPQKLTFLVGVNPQRRSHPLL